MNTIDLQGARLDTLDCRATMCRVAMSFDSSQVEGEFMKSFMYPAKMTPQSKLLAPMGGDVVSRKRNPDGSVKTVFFLSEEAPPVASTTGQ